MPEWNVPQWLDTELKRQMAGTQAPDGLWQRIQHPPAAAPASTNAWMRWLVAAMLIAGALWLPGKVSVPRPHTQTLTARAADQNPDRCPLQCGPPLIDPVYQVAEDWARRLPAYTVVPAHAPHETSGCTACHVAGN